MPAYAVIDGVSTEIGTATYDSVMGCIDVKLVEKKEAKS